MRAGILARWILLLLLGFLGATLVSDLAAAQDAAAPAPKKKGNPKSFWYTYPMPPHRKPADPLAVAPGFQVPEQPERYTWKITGKRIGSKAPPATQVQVFNIDSNGLRVIGQMPVGTEVKLDTFTHFGRTLYYAVPFGAPPEATTSKVKLPPKVAWVSGMSIEPTAFTPADK